MAFSLHRLSREHMHEIATPSPSSELASRAEPGGLPPAFVAERALRRIGPFARR